MPYAAFQSQYNASPEFIPQELVTEYLPPVGGYDEMVDSGGKVRPQWSGVLQLLRELGDPGLEARRVEIARVLRESGVSYNTYQGERRRERDWDLDVIPAVCDAEEWKALTPGLTQRIHLFRMILDDLYGPRRLLNEGIIPPELIHASPAYHLPCVEQLPLAGFKSVALHAIDLARGADGNFIVLGDRTQSPSGLGYALKNRVAISRVLPELFRASSVIPLTDFVRSLEEALRESAPRPLGNPRVVLLTPGPGNETYFEHAFLARILGLTLVEGRDLAVRSGCVWLKTIEGLRRVDVILRRQDDEFCDPLELRADSVLGAPGLVEATRLRNVAICNPLGSGILENPGIQPFLPAIAKCFLGEDLILSSPATWWCGQDRELRHVLENLDSIVVKPISRGLGESTCLGPLMSRRERDELAVRIQLCPSNWVGQEILKLSTIPRHAPGGLSARRMVLRTYGFDFDGGQRILPGGLLRTSPSHDGLSVSNQRGGGSKDFWITAPNAPDWVGASPPLHRSIAPPLEEEAPSRTAENLFWMGRYIERTESLARLVRETVSQMLDLEDRRRREVFPDMLRLLAAHSGISQEGLGPPDGDPFDVKARVAAVTSEPSDPGSIQFNLDRLRESARNLADRLPDEAWRILTDSAAGTPSAMQHGWALETLERMQGLIVSLSALESLCRQTIPRGPTSDFFEIGQRVERGLQCAALLSRALHDSASGDFRNRAEAKAHILAATESLGTYRRIYREEAGWDRVIDMLIIRESNPRSLGCQAQRLAELVQRLPGSYGAAGERVAAISAQLLDLVRNFAPAGAEPILDEDAASNIGGLLWQAIMLLGQFSEALGHAYFTHTASSEMAWRS